MWEEYKYCYVHLITPNNRPTKWRRILRERTGEWVDRNQGALSYFSTIQSFRGADKTEDEEHWSPMFFDLDAKDSKSDISLAELIERLIPVLADARKLVDYFVQGFEIIPEVWFSGGKGFHVVVPGKIFSADPASDLTYHWKHLAAKLEKKLALVSLDWRVYSNPRMWRLSNTQHKSGRYKIPLDLGELGRGIEHILSLAAQPRELQLENESTSKAELTLSRLFKECVDEYNERPKVGEYEGIEAPVFGENLPPCVTYLWENGLALLGTKNQADMALSNYLKAAGITIDKAEVLMSEWARGIPVSVTHISDPEDRVLQTMRVLRTVYSDHKYQFSCGSMRACKMDVDCKECGVEEVSKTLEVPLSDFPAAANYGRRIAVEADVVGKNSGELIVPSEVKGWCNFKPDTAICNRCMMGKYFNSDADRFERTIIFSAKEKLTISLIDVTTASLHNRIKRIFMVEERCYDFLYEAKFGNANVVFLSTRISGDFKLVDEIMRTRAIFLGHEIELNKGYKLYGFVWTHPRTGKAILLIDSIEPLQSSLATFSLEKHQLNELMVFQPNNGQPPLDKIHEIHSILMNNYIRVWGREELLMAIDLVFHSARRFTFQQNEGMKGWLDILVLGDTGQGKSDIAEKLMAYYDLGVMAAGETSSRTGLLYTIHMQAGEESWIAFGLLPRATGYLVVIDEVHGMSPSDFKELTQVRSRGFVDVKRHVFGVAKTETRLISIANCRSKKSLASYNHPVQAIVDIESFTSFEDVRRFDYAVGVRAGDINDSDINQNVNSLPVIDNPYTPELSKNLILWIWTRRPEQIIIQPKTEETILELAMEISQDYIADIPLIESADIRHKLARLAAAIAGRVYSTQDGEHLIVTDEHAVAAHQVLNEFYKSPGLQYYQWSDDRKRIVHSPERLTALIFDFQTTFSDWSQISAWLLDVSEFSKTVLKAACGLSTAEADQLMAFLITNRFIIVDRYKHAKTPSGREFLQSVYASRNQNSPEPLPDEKGDDGF